MPPKPFGGDVFDDLSSSILGDRTFGSSEIDELSNLPQSPTLALTQSNHSQQHLGNDTQQKQRKNQKAMTTSIRGVSKKNQRKNRESPSTSREPTPSLSKAWRPGLGMTPAKNRRYLGPRTEYNTNLPPAAFPSIDPLEPLEARQVQDAPSQASRLPTRSHFADERPDTSQSKRLPTSSTGNIVHDWGREDIRGSQPGSSKVQGNADFWMASTEHRVIDSPQATDLWDRISIYYRLMVLDAVIAAYDPPPDEFQALHRLPLKNTQIQEMVRVLRDRQARSEVEEQAHRKLVRSTTSHLMKSNEPMSEEKFRAALDRTIYKDIEQSDHLVTRLGDLHHARQFLAKVGFDPELLDDVNRSSHPILQEPSGTSRQRLESQAPTGVQLGRASDADPTSSGNPVLKLEIKECTPKPAGANVVSKIAPACDCTPPPCSSAHTLEKNGSSRPHCPIAPVCIATPLEHLPDESHYASDDSRYLDKQTRHNRRAVAAAVHSNPLLRSGTALTGGGGTRGLNSTSTMMKDRPAGDYIFGDWVERMNTIHVENKSMLKNRRILDLMEEDISSQDAI